MSGLILPPWLRRHRLWFIRMDRWSGSLPVVVFIFVVSFGGLARNDYGVLHRWHRITLHSLPTDKTSCFRMNGRVIKYVEQTTQAKDTCDSMFRGRNCFEVPLGNNVEKLTPQKIPLNPRTSICAEFLHQNSMLPKQTKMADTGRVNFQTNCTMKKTQLNANTFRITKQQ